MRIFKVGDRVRVAQIFGDTFGSGITIGDLGIVVEVESDSIGVQFDFTFDCGHDCAGKAIKGRGRYLEPEELELVEPVQEKESPRTFTLFERMDRVRELEIELQKAKKELKDIL
jgi:hypothetical protein